MTKENVDRCHAQGLFVVDEEYAPPRASSRTSRVLEVHPLDLEKQGLAQDVQCVVHLGQEAGHGHLAEQREEV